jgi:hypothetical protein
MARLRAWQATASLADRAAIVFGVVVCLVAVLSEPVWQRSPRPLDALAGAAARHGGRRPGLSPPVPGDGTATLGAVDIAMADVRTSRRRLSPEPCRGHHLSGQGRKAPRRMPQEVAGEVGRVGPQVGPTRGERPSRRR